MSVKTFVQGLKLEPQSADPSGPAEGQLQFADGTARAVGLWQYKSGAWSQVGGTTGVPAVFDVYTTAVDYTVLDNDGYATILVSDSSPTKTITLPTAADNADRRLVIKNTSTDQGKVTVDGEGAETIDGYTTIDLDFKGAYIEIHCDGTSWNIINTNLTSRWKEYSLTVTGSNWTTAVATGVPFRTLDGTWYLEYHITGSLSVSSASFIGTVTGITTSNGSANQLQPINASTTAAGFDYGYWDANTNTYNLGFNATTTRPNINGVVKLQSKPTFVA